MPAPEAKRPRVLVADDHTLVLDGLQKLLESECDVVGTAEDGRALLEIAAELKPDIILLDISMPLLNGIEAAQRLKKIVPHSKLIFVTVHAELAYVKNAFRAGASGYLLKRSATSELAQAVKEVMKGRSFVTPLVTQDVVESFLSDTASEKDHRGTLTRRQREVLQLVAEGRSSKEIATILSIAPQTVEFHKHDIRKQLGLRTIAELTQYAIKHGIVSV